MGVLQAIIGLLFIFIIPGYLISWLSFKKLDFLDRLGISVGLSVCVNIFISLILGFLGFFNLFFVYPILIFLVLVLIIVMRKNIVGYLKNDYKNFKTRKNLFFFLLLAILLVFNFMLVYQVHSNYSGLIQNPHNDAQYYEVKNFNYPFPIHADEWTHLAKSVYFIDKEKIGFVNPYLEGFPPFANFELGFDIFTSEFFLLTGLDPVLDFKFLPAIFMIINSILLFIFVRKITKNNYIGLLSVLFFGTLKSNINLMGNWFFVPMSMSVFLMFLFFYLLINYFENKEKNYLLVGVAVYSITSIIYPMIFILISIIVALFLIIRFYNKKVTWISTLIILGLILLAIFFFDLYFLRFQNWTQTSAGYITFNILKIYGYIFSFLALIGLINLFVKKDNKILLIGFIVPLFFISMDKVFGFTYFIPYTRAVFYFLIFLAPLSGIGLYLLLKTIHGNLKSKRASLILILALLLGVFISGLQNYYDINEQKGVTNVDSKNLVLLYLLEEQDYKAIKFIEDSFGNENVIFTDPLVAVGVYPISKNQIISMIESNLGGWEYDLRSENWKREDPLIYFKFLEANCEDKYVLAENINLILSKFQINCSKFNEIYKKENYVYWVNIQ